MSFPNVDWNVRWKLAKKSFEERTGQKKPSQTFALGIRKSTGIEAALRKCDSARQAFYHEKDLSKRKKLLGEFRKAVQEFKTAVTAYEKVLVAAMSAQEKSAIKPEIDILSKQLTALEASMDSMVRAMEAELAGATGLEFAFKTLVTSLDAAIKRAELFGAQCKTRGEVEFYNRGIVTAGKDILFGLTNVEKLTAKGYAIPNSNDPKKFVVVMKPWCAGQRNLKPTATKKDVVSEAAAFLQVIAGVRKWAESAG